MYTKHNLAADIVDLFDELLSEKVLKYLVLIRMKKLRDMMTVIALVYMGWNTQIL